MDGEDWLDVRASVALCDLERSSFQTPRPHRAAGRSGCPTLPGCQEEVDSTSSDCDRDMSPTPTRTWRALQHMSLRSPLPIADTIGPTG